MNLLKKYGKIVLLWSTITILYLIILTILNYTQLMKLETITKLNFIFVSVITFILGILTGKSSTKKGYIEGLKIGSLITTLLFLLNIIFIRNFNLHIFIYYLTLLISCTFGSMIGINLKKK